MGNKLHPKQTATLEGRSPCGQRLSAGSYDESIGAPTLTG